MNVQFSELLRKPEVGGKATEELDRVIGGERWMEEKYIANHPNINSTVKETMKLHPVAPLLGPRLSREDCEINGYDIPEGTRVLVNLWSIGRDQKCGRTQTSSGRGVCGEVDRRQGAEFELLPFRSGRRMCPGYSLGLKVIQCSLGNLLHGFEWGIGGGIRKEDLDMEGMFGLSTPRKRILVAVVKPRLNSHLYYSM